MVLRFTDINLVESLDVIDVLLKSKVMEKSYNEMIRGMLIQTMNTDTVDPEYASRLFQNSDGVGTDLLTVDIVRGRDHGLAPYHVYRENCHLPPVETFNDLYPSISKEVSVAHKRIRV
jgi:peroxidase